MSKKTHLVVNKVMACNKNIEEVNPKWSTTQTTEHITCKRCKARALKGIQMELKL